MRHSLTCTALLCLALAACGGKDTATGGPTMLQNATSVFGGNDHSCAQPAPSGSAEQVACHTAAKAACPLGTAPNQVDFAEEQGEFLVKGYSCV